MNDRLKELLEPDTLVRPSPGAKAETGTQAGPDDAREEDDDGPDSCCGWLRGVRDRAIALEYRLLAGRGRWPAPDYALIQNRWWEEGGFTVEYAGGLKVTVSGWGLRRVYELFLCNRVTWLEEKGKDAVREKQARLDRVASWIH